MKNWLKRFYPLLLVVVLSAVLRLCFLDRLSIFTYDQARDALYIKRILVDHQLRLIGTQSSIPGLYTGPFYYYLMTPFLWLGHLSPVWLDYATAFFNTLAVGLLYLLIVWNTNNHLVGFLVGLLYATSPIIISQSRFAWNPNLLPLFSLIFLWGIWLLLKKRSAGWLLAAFGFSICLQLHYSSLALIPGLLLFTWFNRRRLPWRHWYFPLSLVIGLTFLSPLLIFDLRHNGINFKAIMNYLRHGTRGQIPPPPFFTGLVSKLRYLLVDLFGVNPPVAIKNLSLVAWLLLLFAGCSKNKFIVWVALFFIFGVVFSGLYQGSFFEFYLALLYPYGFLLLAGVLSGLPRRFVYIGRPMVAGLVLLIIVNFWSALTFNYPQGRLLQINRVAAVIAADKPGDYTFNLAGVLGGDRYDFNAVDFRYFLEVFYHQRSLGWEIGDYQEARVLYLIVRPGLVDPLKNNIMEINYFRPRQVVSRWSAEGLEVYKLIK